MSKNVARYVGVLLCLGCSSKPTTLASDESPQASTPTIPSPIELPTQPAASTPVSATDSSSALPTDSSPALPTDSSPALPTDSLEPTPAPPEIAANFRPCPDGSTLTALTPDAGVARYGTVFGASMYEDSDPSSFEPTYVRVRVTLAGEPVPNCDVAWDTAAGHGWVFPVSETTDPDGVVEAYWTAGDRPSQDAQARITLASGNTETVHFSGRAEPSAETRTNSIHFHSYTRDEYSEYEVSVTPLSGPPSTYFETLGWSGAYAGIQFDGDSSQVLFSVWDTDGKSSELRDAGACNKTVTFGGEGTGTSCRLSLPPSENGSVEGLPDDYMLEVGNTYTTHLVITFPDDCDGTCTDYTVTFTDVTRGLGPISLGTQRYMELTANDSNDLFVEDWWSEAGDDCINGGERSAYFHDMRASVDGVWEPIQEGTFSPNFRPDNNEICSNYLASVEDSRLLLSSGGARYVGRPLMLDNQDMRLR